VNINFTLIGQMLTFALFVWFTMTYVWPQLEAVILARANNKVVTLIEDAKKDAKNECDNMIKTAKVHIQQEKNQARANLQAEIVSLVIKGVEKILSKSINNKDNADIISKIIRKG
jgi:F-type H+-transporting ATPase subunit b